MPAWVRATTIDELAARGHVIVRRGGRQIVLFPSSGGVRACSNRCPHEGYPLSEGTLDANCVLTCNWHNWKFDLRTGENLYGGDRLRVYPVEVRGTEVWVDLADPPPERRQEAILADLADAFDDNDYGRMARELARADLLDLNPKQALARAVVRAHDRLEFGWTHAYAGIADWLTLHAERPHEPETRLICLLEGLAHLADDVVREKRYPYTPRRERYDADAFLEAVEAEDEDTAVAMLRGALGAGLRFDALQAVLSRAALRHYNDFGHSLIYVQKAGDLVAHLGQEVVEPLLLALTRSLVFARREDLVPEFRGYADALERWGRVARRPDPHMDAYRKLGIDDALQRTLETSRANPLAIHQALLGANAANMLAFDLQRQDRARIPVSDNVGWLDFTHGITFSSAVRAQCTRCPQLWPMGLLQMACFSGRNARHTVAAPDLDRWRVGDADAFLADALAGLFDHGRGEFIVSVHLLKTLLAVRAEVSASPAGPVSDHLLAAAHRFLRSPLKRKHVRRTVHQAMTFVARDG